MHGHQLRGVESSTAMKGDVAPHLRSLFADPCEPTRATSHEIHMHPKMHGLRGPEGPSEGSRFFRNPKPHLEPTAHPSVVRAWRVKRTVEPLPHFPLAPGVTYRANAMRQTAEVFCSASPREG